LASSLAFIHCHHDLLLRIVIIIIIIIISFVCGGLIHSTTFRLVPTRLSTLLSAWPGRHSHRPESSANNSASNRRHRTSRAILRHSVQIVDQVQQRVFKVVSLQRARLRLFELQSHCERMRAIASSTY
jgi:hypothetical protein